MQHKMETLERARQDLQADLDTARHYIVALMEASAKIGHFSMRTGGGYENVGKAWQGIHRYIAGTQWGKDLGLDTLEQDGFTPMDGSTSARASSRLAVTAEESFASHAASCKLSQCHNDASLIVCSHRIATLTLHACACSCLVGRAQGAEL